MQRDVPISQPVHHWNEREDHWRTITSGLITAVVEIMDCHAAACSIELRHPFMDKRLIEFCLALPPEQKLHQGWSRLIMRRAMANILPTEIQWRSTKANMNHSFVHGLLNLNREILVVASQKYKYIENYVDKNYLNETYHRIISNNKINPDDAIIVWKATMLCLWMYQNGFKQN